MVVQPTPQKKPKMNTIGLRTQKSRERDEKSGKD